jgi:hypothetical protein
MSIQSSLLAALLEAGLIVTPDFAPLLVGLVVGVCLGVLACAVALGVYDTCWPPQDKPSEAPLTVLELSDAA